MATKIQGATDSLSLNDRAGLALLISNCYHIDTKPEWIVSCDYLMDTSSQIDYSICVREKMIVDEQFSVFTTFLNHLEDILWFVQHELFHLKTSDGLKHGILHLQMIQNLQRQIIHEQEESLRIMSSLKKKSLPELSKTVEIADPILETLNHLNQATDEYFVVSWDFHHQLAYWNSRMLHLVAVIGLFLWFISLTIMRLQITYTTLSILFPLILNSLSLISATWSIKIMLSLVLTAWLKSHLSNYTRGSAKENSLSERRRITSLNLERLKSIQNVMLQE